ncbi:MAG TPA: hypothetical protein VFW05_10870 [Verrucomicrobiae bacterium]|nr:hypothetical protein [Verrucomicrobiae bacterium]
MRSIQPALFLAAVHFTVSSLAGTVITNNLPPDTAIINIDARQDGIANFSGGQAFWYQPFFTGGATELLHYQVPPGTYTFRVINPADARAMFPNLTTEQTNQIFTAWTFNSPWITDYMVFTSAAATNNTIPQLFDGACTNLFSNGPFFNNAASAYSGAVNGNFANAIRTSESGGRGSTNFVYSYTFAHADDLIFGVPDNILSDNSGGVSVLVTPAGPSLHVSLAAANLVLQWPTNFSNYTLQHAFSLNPVIAWSTVTNVSQLSGPDFVVTLPATNNAEYFRLTKL